MLRQHTPEHRSEKRTVYFLMSCIEVRIFDQQVWVLKSTFLLCMRYVDFVQDEFVGNDIEIVGSPHTWCATLEHSIIAFHRLSNAWGTHYIPSTQLVAVVIITLCFIVGVRIHIFFSDYCRLLNII